MSVNRMLCLGIAMMALPAQEVIAGFTDTKNRTELRVDVETIPPKVVYELSRTIGAGRILKAEPGKPGKVTRTYSVAFHEGRPVSKTLIEKKVEPAKPTLYLMGMGGYKPSRSRFDLGKVKTMHASAYDPSPRTIPGGTGRTATGAKAMFGCVAVDPRVIPLGTHLYIEGYGFGIANDKGSAIKGNRIDLCYNSRAQALAFGRKTVKVHILSGSR